MNKTQELITANWTITHVVKTIDSLLMNAKQKILESDQKEFLKDGSQANKILKVYFELEHLLKSADKVSDFIHKIDN